MYTKFKASTVTAAALRNAANLVKKGVLNNVWFRFSIKCFVFAHYRTF